MLATPDPDQAPGEHAPVECCSTDDEDASSTASLSDHDDCESLPSLEDATDVDSLDFEGVMPDITADPSPDPEGGDTAAATEQHDSAQPTLDPNDQQGDELNPGTVDQDADEAEVTNQADSANHVRPTRPRLEPLDQATIDILKLHGFTALS